MAGLAVFIVGFMCGVSVALHFSKKKIFALQRQLDEKTIEGWVDWAARQRREAGDGKAV